MFLFHVLVVSTGGWIITSSMYLGEEERHDPGQRFVCFGVLAGKGAPILDGTSMAPLKTVTLPL